MKIRLAILALLVLPSSTAARAEHPCPGVPIQRVLLAGCDASDCRSHAAITRLLSGVHAADDDSTPVSEDDLTRLARELTETKLAAHPPTFTCDGDLGTLTVNVVPQTFIRKFTIAGNDVFRQKDILKRVFLRPGTPLTLDPARPMDNPDVVRQVDSVLRLYRQAGLDTASAQVAARVVSKTELDLDLVISEGARARIDTVEARHLRHGARGDGPDDCPTITPRRLERLTGVEAGDVVTRLTERQIKEKVRSAFQAAGWLRPRLAIDAAASRMLVTVETDHCWVIRVWERDLATPSTDAELSFRWTDPLLRPGATDAGYRRSPLEEWARVLPFGESGAFDADEAARGLDAIARELRARGYPFAEVALQHRERGDGGGGGQPGSAGPSGGGEVMGTIDYLITLNLPRRITAVVIAGNHGFDSDTLREQMKSQAYDFFGSPGAFDEARVLADLVVLRDYYRDRGYLAMRFVDAAPGGTDGTITREVLPPAADASERGGGESDKIVWRYRAGDLAFRVVQRPSELHLGLHIAIDEGPRTNVRTLVVRGNSLLSSERVATLARLGPGRPFGKKPLADALEALAKAYRAVGHHASQVRVSCRVEGDAEPGACDAARLFGKGDVDVVMDLHEGPPVVVKAIVWRGNAETDPHVLIRDLPRVGERLNLDQINVAVRRMRALGLFNSVRVDVLGLDEAELSANASVSSEVPVTLVVSVEETGYRFIDVAAGLRSIQRANVGRVPRWAADGAGTLVDQADRISTGFGRSFALDIPDLLVTAEVEYLDLNVAHIGNQLRIPFLAGFSLSQFLRLATFDPSLTFPRIFDSSVTLTTRLIAELDRVTDPLDRLEIGAEVDASVPLSDSMLAGVTARAGVIQLEAPDDACVYCLAAPPAGWSTQLPQEVGEKTATAASCDGDEDDPACADGGFRPQVTVTLRWRWDRQDTPLHPTRGLVLAAATSFIVDRDRESTAPKFNQFVKWEASVRGALSLGPMILAGFFRYGGAATFGERFLPLDERYTLGGSNGLRGFADNGVCRYERDRSLAADCGEEFGGNVLLNGSLELRAPLVESVGLWLGAFLDAGGLAETHDRLYLESIRWGAGVGVRFLLGGLFPIRLDFGFPVFERRCAALTADGACVREDVSQVHFDLLYTF